MGSAASVSGNCSASSFFSDEEIIDGSKYLSEDEYFRETFVNFVKSGTWKEILSCIVPKEDNIVLSLDHIGREKICIVNDYAVSRAKVSELKLLCGNDVSLRTSRKSLLDGSSSPNHRSGRFTESSEASTSRILECGAFSTDQICSILFAAVYPIFAASADVEESITATYSVDEENEAEDQKPAVPAITKRGQDMLQACAFDLSEDHLMDFLAEAAWAQSIPEAVENFPLGITLIDTITDGFPIVYANKAFLNLTNYTSSQLLGQKFQMLSGPDSEESQLALIREAISGSQSAKVAVVQYARGAKKGFLDLIAIRACGRYSIAVHFPAIKSSRLTDLKMVDDVLALLVYVLKPPPVVSSTHTSTSTTATQKTRRTRGGGLRTPLQPHRHYIPPENCSSTGTGKGIAKCNLDTVSTAAAISHDASGDTYTVERVLSLSKTTSADGYIYRNESCVTLEASKEHSFAHTVVV